MATEKTPIKTVVRYRSGEETRLASGITSVTRWLYGGVREETDDSGNTTTVEVPPDPHRLMELGGVDDGSRVHVDVTQVEELREVK